MNSDQRNLLFIPRGEERKKKMIESDARYKRQRLWLFVVCVAVLMSAEVHVSVARLPNFGHIFVVIMENREFSSVIGNTEAPYYNRFS